MLLNREFVMNYKRKPLQFNNKQFRLNDKGLSLVELLVAVAILAIILVPLLNSFVMGAKANSRAERMQTETLLAQNILEELKGKSIEEVAEKLGYDGNLDMDFSREEPYVFNVKDISFRGYDFDARIKLDPTPYYEVQNTEEYGDYNKFQMPIIEEINKDTNVLALESDEMDHAKTELYYNHLTYIANLDSADEDDYLTREEFDDEIKYDLRRRIEVNLTKNLTGFLVNVNYDYSAPAIRGAGEVSYVIYEDYIEPKLEGLYVFYYPTKNDAVIVNTHDFNEEDFYIDLFLIRQEEENSIGNDNVKVKAVSSDKIHIYSNTEIIELTGTVLNKGLVKKENQRNRIYEVTVSLYQGGKNFAKEAFALELTSTKGE